MPDDHTHLQGYKPQLERSGRERPLAHLWSLVKGTARREAFLHGHALGFELRILDESAELVFMQTRETESECVLVAAAHHDQYRAKGWEQVPPQS